MSEITHGCQIVLIAEFLNFGACQREANRINGVLRSLQHFFIVFTHSDVLHFVYSIVKGVITSVVNQFVHGIVATEYKETLVSHLVFHDVFGGA